MLRDRAERLERAFWMWRLRLSRVRALLPVSVVTGAAALGVLLSDLALGGPPRPARRRPHRAASRRASV